MFVAIAQLLFVSSFLLSTAGGVSTPEGIKKYMDQLNGHRSRVAKEYNVSNMNALSWDDGLASEAASLPCDWDAFGEHPKYVLPYFRFPQKLTAEEADEIVKKALVGPVSRVEHLASRIGIIHPTQTKIGCVDTACTVLVGSAGNAQYQMDTLCVVAPSIEAMSVLFKRGPAGSACGSVPAINGLCGSWDNNVGVPVKHVGGSGSSRTTQGPGGSERPNSSLGTQPREATTTSAAGLSLSLSLFLFYFLFNSLFLQ